MFSQVTRIGDDGHFPLVRFEKLHVYPRDYACDDLESGHALGFLSPSEYDQQFCCMAAFALDRQDRYRGYLVGLPQQRQIRLFVRDQHTQAILLNVDIASVVDMPGTMHSKTNAWIMDCDNDHKLDVLIAIDLIDYEFPTDAAPNMSGTQQFRYSLSNGKMKYLAWPEGLDLGAMQE